MVPHKSCVGSVLMKGNSDSFSSFIIDMDSTVNHLLNFARLCILPSVVKDYQETQQLRLRQEEDTNYLPFTPFAINQEEHEGRSGYAKLASFAFVAASTNPHDTRMLIAAEAFKRRAYHLLRTRVSNFAKIKPGQQVRRQGADIEKSNLCWCMYLLAAAEVASRHNEEASLHFQMVNQLLAQGADIDRMRLHAILYTDTQRAAVSLSRPIIHLEEWAISNLPSTWNDVSAAKLISPPYPRPLDRSLSDCNLRSLFLNIRQTQIASSQLQDLPPSLNGDEFLITLSFLVVYIPRPTHQRIPRQVRLLHSGLSVLAPVPHHARYIWCWYFVALKGREHVLRCRADHSTLPQADAGR